MIYRSGKAGAKRQGGVVRIQHTRGKLVMTMASLVSGFGRPLFLSRIFVRSSFHFRVEASARTMAANKEPLASSRKVRGAISEIQDTSLSPTSYPLSRWQVIRPNSGWL